MTTPRRGFIKTGLFAGMIALLPSQAAKVFAQKRGRASQSRVPSRENPLDYYNKSTFEPYTNSFFQILIGGRLAAEMKLERVDELGYAGGENFSLVFQPSSGARLPQHTYEIEHAALGKFQLFLVPVNKEIDLRYEAIIDRRR